jgi:uncharacterized protein YkwD
MRSNPKSFFLIAVALCAPALLRAAQQQYDSGDPTAAEQQVLEFINRARANPTAEGQRLGININEGLDAGLTAVARPPLAMNKILLGTSRAHSQDMWTRKFFAHVNPDGLDPFQRMHAAGYDGNPAGENIATGSSDVNGSAVALEDILMVDKNYPHRAHRVNLLDIGSGAVYREIGVGYFAGPSPIAGASDPNLNGLKNFITQDFGTTAAGPFVLGVVFSDKNGNGIYDPGEGLAGVTIAPDSGSFFAVTGTAGGYAFPAGTSGTITLTASGGSLSAPIVKMASLSGVNTKVDFIPGGVSLAAPVITSALTATGSVNSNFTYAITATGTQPITFTAAGLPPGLVLSGSTISGTPTQAGQYMVMLVAKNDVGSDPKTLVISISAGIPQVFTPKKLTIHLNFATPNADSITLTGTLPVPLGFMPSGQQVTVNVGGVVRTFMLDPKGAAGTPATDSLKFRFKSKKGVVQESAAPFTAKFIRSSFANTLVPLGLIDGTVSTTVLIPVTIQFNQQSYSATVMDKYSAMMGKTGTAK